MAHCKPLKYCLDLPEVSVGCPHWLRSWCTMGITRHRPESQVRRDSERVGFFVLREKWIGQVEEKQIWAIPIKSAQCYGCRIDFIIILEKYALLFNWPAIIAGRYAEYFFSSYHYLLIKEFKLADEEFNQAMGAAAENGAINPPLAEEFVYVPDPEHPGVDPELAAAGEHDVEASLAYLFANSIEYHYTPEGVDSDISIS